MGLFPPAPGGWEKVEYGYKGKGVVIHLLTDGLGNPLSITTTPANGDERLQVTTLIKKLPNYPQKNMPILEADKDYDSFLLRSQLLEMNIFPLIPYRKNNHKANNFKKLFVKKSIRWKVERTFSWIKRKCRRLLMRWERKVCVWEAFTILAVAYLWTTNLVG